MSVTFETATLVRLMKVIKSAVATRSHFAQLGHVTFRRTDDGVTMSATDLDMELTLEVPNATMDSDAFTLECQALNKFLASADKGSLVTIEPEAETADADRLSHAVELDGITATLDGFKIEDMPLPMVPELLPTSVVMSEAEIYAALDTVKHAISTEQTHYYLNGVYMHATDQTRHKLAFVTTDGHRLAIVKTKHETALIDESHWEMTCIIPHASVTAIMAALDPKSDSPVIIQWCERFSTFAGASFRLSTKNVDGTFPDYTRVIPSMIDARLRLDDVLISKQVSRMAKLGVRAVKMDPDAGTISGHDRENVNQKFSANHDFAVNGDLPEPFGVNAKYLLDTIAASVKLGGTSRIEKSTSAGDPMVIRPESSGPFEDARFVLMPMRH